MLTVKKLKSLKPQSKPYFIRSSNPRGLGVKINPSGSIKFIVEVKHHGKAHRRTIGDYPIMSLNEAKAVAVNTIRRILDCQAEPMTLKVLLERYIQTVTLKPNTIRNYSEVINIYLNDWLESSVNDITKPMIEKRFYQIRDKGIRGGRPTYSQATKVMRILSALMNYARADEVIEQNPVEVLKLKRVDRSIKKRDDYLPANIASELLSLTALESHPVTLAIHLMLRTGLRKNEALKLKWDDLEHIEGIPCLIIRDTKNHRAHYVPVTQEIQHILDRAANDTEFIFPSTQREGKPMEDVRPTLKRLSKLISFTFRCHDLRRTFATRATEVGIDYLMVKRLLNHKSNDITAQYIQWHSRENLLVMREALERVTY